MSKAIHNLDNTVIPADGGPVNISPSVPDTDAFEHEYQDDPDDRLLRACNGLRDEVVFPRLRENGVPERELHAFAMSLVRDVQYGLDHSGEMRKLLGVRFQGIHGTVADTEVQ